MASIAETAFEPKVTNLQRNNTQNIAGTFVVEEDPAICPSGFLCCRAGLIDNQGYESFGILNTNTWRMEPAELGIPEPSANIGYGDHTGIYAFNSYDVPKAGNNNGNIYNLGGTTLGLELPAGEIGTFTEIIIGEYYKFGKGNFSTAPGSGDNYATIEDGMLVASNAMPDDGGVCFEILFKEGFTKGARYAFDGYILRAIRAPEPEPEEPGPGVE